MIVRPINGTVNSRGLENHEDHDVSVYTG